jgi:hypothetical protein
LATGGYIVNRPAEDDKALCRAGTRDGRVGYDRASRAELSSINPMLPLYSDVGPRRLLPNAGASENGERAPLFTVPLMSNPSAARLLSSSALWFENSSAAGHQ